MSENHKEYIAVFPNSTKALRIYASRKDAYSSLYEISFIFVWESCKEDKKLGKKRLEIGYYTDILNIPSM